MNTAVTAPFPQSLGEQDCNGKSLVGTDNAYRNRSLQ